MEKSIPSELQEKFYINRGTVKLTESIMHAAKTKISSRIRATWPVFSLSAGRQFGPLATNYKWLCRNRGKPTKAIIRAAMPKISLHIRTV